MRPHHQAMLDMILDVIRRDYAEDVAIFLIYGSCVNGTADNGSDLDMLFVPKTEKGWGLGKTFIYRGCGNDLWGTGWETLERFANFEDMRVSVLADSRLVYYAAEEDRERYEALKRRALETERGDVTPGLIEKAEGCLATAKQYYGELCLTGKAICVGGILYEISDAVCALNHTFLHFGTKRMREEMAAFARLPEGFARAWDAAVCFETAERAKEACGELIRGVDALAREMRGEVAPAAACADFAGLYEEISSHWNKIERGCAANDAAMVLLAAASLQDELDRVQRELGVSMEALRFIDRFDARRLGAFAEAARRAEEAFVGLLESHGVKVARFEGLEELRGYLSPG